MVSELNRSVSLQNEVIGNQSYYEITNNSEKNDLYDFDFVVSDVILREAVPGLAAAEES
jgi:hypothetical protein